MEFCYTGDYGKVYYNPISGEYDVLDQENDYVGTLSFDVRRDGDIDIFI